MRLVVVKQVASFRFYLTKLLRLDAAAQREDISGDFEQYSVVSLFFLLV